MRYPPSSSAFFNATPVFDRADFAKAVGRSPGERAVTNLLSYHLRSGRIRRIARGVFASVAPGAPVAPGARVRGGSAQEAFKVDRFLAASRLRAGAVVAYHSALELHGCAGSDASEVQLIAPGEPGRFHAAELVCRFVSPPRRSPRRFSSSDGVTTVTRQGLTVHVTTLEQTLADSFDRYDLAGGAEELFHSLDLAAALDSGVDVEALVGSAERLGNSTAVGALGFWLQCERERLEVSDGALEELRALAPRQSRYALGAVPGSGRAAKGWNVILPTEVVERYFDD